MANAAGGIFKHPPAAYRGVQIPPCLIKINIPNIPNELLHPIIASGKLGALRYFPLDREGQNEQAILQHDHERFVEIERPKGKEDT